MGQEPLRSLRPDSHRDRPEGAGGVHRPGRREAGAIRRGHAGRHRTRTHGRPRRHGRGDGQQEPQGHRRARQGSAGVLRCQGLPGHGQVRQRQHQGELPGHEPARHGRRRTQHRALRRPSAAQLARWKLGQGPRHQRPTHPGDHLRAPHLLFRLPDRLRQDRQDRRWPVGGHAGTRAGIRNPVRLRRHAAQRRSEQHCAHQHAVQRLWAGYDQHLSLHRLCHGGLREGDADSGRCRRPRSDLGQRRGNRQPASTRLRIARA